MQTTKKRRKYIFQSRAHSEEAYQEAHDRALRAEWFATSLLRGSITWVIAPDTNYWKYHIGFFTTRYRGFVVIANNRDGSEMHCIDAIHDVDELEATIQILSQSSHESDRAISETLIEARKLCYAKMSD